MIECFVMIIWLAAAFMGSQVFNFNSPLFPQVFNFNISVLALPCSFDVGGFWGDGDGKQTPWWYFKKKHYHVKKTFTIIVDIYKNMILQNRIASELFDLFRCRTTLCGGSSCSFPSSRFWLSPSSSLELSSGTSFWSARGSVLGEFEQTSSPYLSDFWVLFW